MWSRKLTCATARARSTLSHYVQTCSSLALLTHDFQDTGDVLRSVCQSEVLAASFIPSSSCVWLYRTSLWPFRYIAVSNRVGPLHGRHFPPPGCSCQCTDHSQLLNSHANQPERRNRRHSTVIGLKLPPLQCVFIWYLTV